MKFAHLADVHIGCWRDPNLRELSMKSFSESVNICIQKKVDFVLISGDLFHTSLPSVDYLKKSVGALKKLKHHGIPVYYIAGSHDFSPSGKTMLDVLEEAELCKSVFRGDIVDNKLHLKFTVDEKTGAKISGIIGKKGMLDREYYENIGNREELESEDGFKIFMFHTALDELKPKELEKMESYPASFLPKGFDYYAGGHVHIVKKVSIPGYNNLIYPGPLFPANISEMEKLGNGGFYVYDNGEIERVEVKLKQVAIHNHTVNDVGSAQTLINESVDNIKDKIAIYRFQGMLDTGKPSDIDWRPVINSEAYAFLRNTVKLQSVELEQIKINESDQENIEEQIFAEHKGQIRHEFDDEINTATSLLQQLSQSKAEGEKKYEYDERMIKTGLDILRLNNE